MFRDGEIFRFLFSADQRWERKLQSKEVSMRICEKCKATTLRSCQPWPDMSFKIKSKNSPCSLETQLILQSMKIRWSFQSLLIYKQLTFTVCCFFNYFLFSIYVKSAKFHWLNARAKMITIRKLRKLFTLDFGLFVTPRAWTVEHNSKTFFLFIFSRFIVAIHF